MAQVFDEVVGNVEEVIEEMISGEEPSPLA